MTSFVSKFASLLRSLDDKLFSFWHLQAEAFPFSHVKGIFRFETGIKTNEFRDLRANPRCLLESQIISFRTRYARMRTSALFNRPGTATPQTQGQNASLTLNHTLNHTHNHAQQQNLGVAITGPGTSLAFDPYSTTPLPRRLIATGAAANFPSVVNLLGDVFNAPIFIPQSQLDSAHAVAPTGTGSGVAGGPMAQFAAAHRNAPAPGFPSRAALGGAYVARWAWSRERAGAGAVAYEDEVRRLLARRWNVTVGLRTKGGAHSPAPYLKHQRSSGLGADVLVEEDEEEFEEGGYRPSGAGGGTTAGSGSGYNSSSGLVPTPVSASSYSMPTSTPPPRVRTATGSSLATSAGASVLAVSPGVSVAGSTFTNLTSPDVSSSYGGGPPGSGSVVMAGGSGAMTPTTDLSGVGMGGAPPSSSGGGGTGITPLTPIGALPTADAEAQVGWTKVAEPDTDAFMAYASIIPEFVRLEGLLIKSLV